MLYLQHFVMTPYFLDSNYINLAKGGTLFPLAMSDTDT